ncbi:motility associated factor glycosyltransferase family protein [Pseudoalteromonas rubra]|uniref:Septum formation inhibitor Maf n=1 Tax=Pseudoalteromonas rubra TaxID=43658 RepID=A0A5S3WWK0_9GAMM|nr:6-hydroxymethylpterin diphosphokinase MptE-like protein [Pseudoalteromonas rubra]TMP33840.1 septum formation inhibitor Maf [Pseudoalteromonas rubra]
MNKDPISQQLESLSEKLTETTAHQAREAEFAKEANERFSKNLQSFEKYYPDIAKAITNHSVREDFCLHVTTSGHGNFVPQGSSAPIYSQSPIEQTTEQVERQLSKPVLSLTDYTGYGQNQEDERLHVRYMTELTNLMIDIRDQGQAPLSKIPEHFPSAVIFGIGLGYHIPLLLERTQFDYIFLIEPDFEQFFASLFCTDWFKVIADIDEQGGCLFFHLGVDHSLFIQDIEKVAEDVGAFALVRSFCYQHTPGAQLNTLIRQWAKDYFRFQFGHGFYNDAVTGLAHSIHHVRNKAAWLTRSTSNINKDTPVFIIGNGPSLDEAEAFIKRNYEKAIVIAAGTSIATLYNKGIPVDFHALVERPYSNYKIFGDIVPPEVYQDINLIGLSTLYPDTNQRYKWAGIAAKGAEAGTSMMDLLALCHMSQTLPKIPYSNPVVANTALSFVLYMGFRNVYLFGIDNGKDPKGAHHSKDSIYRPSNEDDESQGYGHLEISGHTLPANFGGVVVSNDLLMIAHAQLEKLLRYYDVDTCLNVGSGAKIAKALPVKAEDLLDIEEEFDIHATVEAIKSECFNVFPMDDVSDEVVALDGLKDMVEHICSIASEPVRTRKEAADQLRRQARYVFAYRDSKWGHLFHVLKGSLLYYHCPLITLLYTYEDEAFCLEQYQRLNQLWMSYIKEIYAHFCEHYTDKCDLGRE